MNIRVLKLSLIVGLACALSGCSAARLLGGGSTTATQAPTVQVGNQLALPPDLALQAPRQTVDTYQPNGPVASLETPQADQELYSAAPARPGVQPKQRGGTLDETLAFYNVSKTRPDGTPKTSAELNQELSAAIKAEKRRANPNYGTIFNIGQIFSDG